MKIQICAYAHVFLRLCIPTIFSVHRKNTSPVRKIFFPNWGKKQAVIAEMPCIIVKVLHYYKP